ncbi:4'-phosphopantetheinyl transferase superfamily protein [Flavobacterium sp. GT3R68]|uniref:4'-phosphopantetheinyl transferase family protein n=1 Tax=Flavobacterium sp. GT3R68 TaxID=2594437 RepID=UPI000F89321C|nr:4'-phosphopantetheinyl transferase superfamily protein [Flavobacterium sp. GT3R68]RTY93659.1 4-phosphopantetheinyl transferase family protein [Flavobacterium sp. GSN2]TRW91620.1 4-phosphopantetheinyl transferase family protein [Flavobacterium sp. GT3R68]
MIGNDIIDLALAKKESNWKREGFLNKIFTAEEQLLIFQSSTPENMVWNLWSRKEAAYKIYNRQTQIRNYNPMQFVCSDVHLAVGKVICKENVYFVKTEITNEYIHTIAVTSIKDFKKLEILDFAIKIYKKDGIPEILIKNDTLLKPISISHHGRFERRIMIS